MTYTFGYSGEKPPNPPQWMEETYELSVQDVLLVAEQQLACTEFDVSFETAPYQAYGPDSERVWSNLISGQWASDEVVSLLVF